MAKPTKKNIGLARRRLGFTIAEALVACEMVDDVELDRAGKLISGMIPMDYAELAARDYEICDTINDAFKDHQPGYMERLREALGMKQGTLGEVLEAAIAKLGKFD